MSVKFKVGTQAYGWSQIAVRDGRNWENSLDWALSQAADAGLASWEPLVDDFSQIHMIAAATERFGLDIRSIYMGGNLHDQAIAPRTVDSMVKIAQAAHEHGTTLAVVNPNPIDWNVKDDKSDAQLSYQLDRLIELGEKLKRIGMTLCYHTHDAEMRQGAREFHHMLANSDRATVRLCLDPHWIYRGAGNSQLAVLDIVKLYGDRIEEIHIRQSKSGIWDEVVSEGDLDYGALVAEVRQAGATPFLVVEHALEEGTPNRLENVEAHRRSRVFIENIFAPLAPTN